MECHKKLLIKGNAILNKEYTSNSYQPSKHVRKKYKLMCLRICNHI